MNWARMLAYITGTVDQELLLRNEYLAAENRILKGQIKGRPLHQRPRPLPKRRLRRRIAGHGQRVRRRASGNPKAQRKSKNLTEVPALRYTPR